MPINLTTNGELSNLTSSVLSINQGSTTLSNSDFSAKTYSIPASLRENTGSARREIRVSGLKNYDNTSFDIGTSVYQIGTAQPSPVVSLSSNDINPRDFFVAHVGNRQYTILPAEQKGGMALWDSVRNLWAVANMNTYIRYFGGKYELIAINGTTIRTRDGSNDNRWLANSDACSPYVMPWNAVWQGDVIPWAPQFGVAAIIDVSKNSINAMQKPTTLAIESFKFPVSGATSTSFPINSFKGLEYRKLIFKGSEGVDNGSRGVDMIYSYAQNKWLLTIYEQYTYEDTFDRDALKYEAPYSTAFPITFTYVSREKAQGYGTPATTLVVSKVTSTNFDAVYTLADVSYPTTIPVDSAFSSIW
jgi:hypothetical protein